IMIKAMADEAHKMGARFVVVYLGYLPRGRVSPPPKELLDAVHGLDLTFVDFAPVAASFYEHDPDGTLILPDDRHPNPLAHRMIAETLAGPVRALLAGDAREGSTHANRAD